MAVLMPVPGSNPFLALSIGSLLLSVLIASLLVSYVPTGFNFATSTSSEGRLYSERNQTKVNDDQFSSPAETPAFAPIALPVNELPESQSANNSVQSANNSVVTDDYDSKQYNESTENSLASSNQTVSAAPRDDQKSNFSSIAELPVLAPSFLSRNVTVAARPSPRPVDRSCDLFHGKWIYDPLGPLYTNTSCPIIVEPQNCQGNGRPDKGYESWRWRPERCEIPRFDGREFLELMRGKTLAFVGDSLARNQMDSLLCVLWQTEVPVRQGRRHLHMWYFPSTSTSIARVWSAWLVRSLPLPGPSASPRAVTVHLDAPDDGFLQFLPEFDALVISSGHWFTAESTYVLDGTSVRRQLRRRSKSHKTKSPKMNDNIGFYSVALRTALTAIASHRNYSGLTILRSYSPEHYQHGRWNTGGSCAGAMTPAAKSEVNGYAIAMREVQAMEFESAKKKLKNDSRFRFMDVTYMSGYRHDGHSGPYRSKLGKKQGEPEDCVHWCMPGTADSWNEILFEILKREL